jgi:hypothetical protein
VGSGGGVTDLERFANWPVLIDGATCDDDGAQGVL